MFRKSRVVDDETAAWWKVADGIADNPNGTGLDQLLAHAQPLSLDESEQREEMMDGLRQLLSLAAASDLPVLDTQHRVIGVDACHFAAPATLVLDVGAPGKLFLTSNRLVFAGGRVQAWPWHRLRDVMRRGRELFITIAGAEALVRLHCNTYGDAMTARHIALRLTGSKRG